QSVSAMMLAAAEVETSTCASSPRAVTAAERSGSHVTAASTCLALNMAAAAGASCVKMMFFSTSARSAGESPDCASRYRIKKCDGVNCVQAILWPLSSSIDLIDDSETMPSPPRDQSCITIERAFRLFSARIDASRAQLSTVFHMMSTSPLRNAASFAAGSSISTNLTSMLNRLRYCEPGPASNPSLKTMPGAWPAQVLMATTSVRFNLPLPVSPTDCKHLEP